MGDGSFPQSHGANVRATCPQRGLKPRGFTLIELLVTLTVASILLAVAMPSFSSYVQSTRLTTEADSLVYALTMARSDAVKFDTPVEVCASSDGATCSGTWTNGWIVLCPANCPASLGAAPVLLMSAPSLHTGNTADELVSAATTMSFQSTGQPAAGNLQFVFCDSRGAAFGRDVEVNSIGEIASSSTPGETVSNVALGGC
jgi:type IV fimbrial biogenesis protein FimT